MKIIVGLGNPGKKYQKTHHNLGFRVIDELRRKNNFPDFKLKKEIYSLISQGKFNGRKIILVKPQTSMNNSGKAVEKIMANGKYQMANLCVIHDDIDLPLGKIRIVKNRGSAGHKGVESIIRELGTKNFIRFRIGICPKTGKPKNPEKFVLEKFNKEEEKVVKEVIKKTAEAIEFFLKEGLEKTMTKFNI